MLNGQDGHRAYVRGQADPGMQHGPGVIKQQTASSLLCEEGA